MYQFRSSALTPSERDDLLLLRNEVAKLRELLSDVEKERDELKSELETCFEQLNKFEENMDQARKGEIDRDKRLQYSGTSLYRTHWTSKFVHCREVVHSSEVKKCISTIGKAIFGASESVLCREVVYMVSFSGIPSITDLRFCRLLCFTNSGMICA